MTTQSLVFQDTTFDVIDRCGIPWLRGYQVGSALKYSQPDAAIAKLYDRNADEFTDKMTALLDVETAGGKQKVRIFSLRGAYLLAMLAKTEVAKAFRKWSLDVLEGESQIPFCPHKDIQDELYRVSGGKRTIIVELSRLLRDRFGVSRYFDIPTHQCKAAVEYVRSFENTKWPKKESLPLFDKHLSQAELLGQHMIQLYKQGKLNDDDIRVLSDLMHNLAKQKPVNQVVQVQPLAAISTTDQDKVSYAYAIAAEVASCASKTVFNAVLAQKEWKHTRFVFGLTNNSPTHYVPYALKIDDRAMITTVAELPMRLLSVDLQVGNKELFDIAAACNHKLSMRFDQKLLIN